MSDPQQAGRARSISQTIAEFASSLTLADIPADVVERAKLSVLDSIGIAFVSSRLPFAHQAVRALGELGAQGRSPVIGLDDRLSVRDSAMLNGILVHGLDYDDTHIAGIVHPSAGALPAALAIATHANLGGDELLCGYILGVEIASRLGAAAGGGFHAVGFHPTGLVGAFAAATLVGRLKGLSAHHISQAQGFAGSLASGSQQFVVSGAWTKRVHGGWAAQAGIVSASFAEQGFVCPDEIYEGRFGLYRTHVHDQQSVDLTRIVEGLGATWQARGVAVKAYPACHFLHAFVDIVLDLHAEGLRSEDVERIRCLIAPDLIPIVCEPSAAKRKPASEYDAKFSLPFAVAAALCRGRLTLGEFDESTRSDPAILDVAARVDHAEDSRSGYPQSFPGDVTVVMRDGRRVHRRLAANRGGPESPLPAASVIAKFHDNLAHVGAERRGPAIVDAVMEIEACTDSADIGALLAGASTDPRGPAD